MEELAVLEEKKELRTCVVTKAYVRSLTDTLNAISGKWKLPIIASLLPGKKRFKAILNHIPELTPRMLSKELKELEVNGMVTRTVYPTVPVTVEYELTNSGHSIKPMLDVMVEWGKQHREINISMPN